ncbi:hypothetical protein ANO11243_019430 [Dothideomycetidae sp. 11243]|nr:hypothetical protein ANO11243_019430 [fungal sp. No.11243]
MCRWFAYISPDEPCLVSDVLITPPHGLTQQVSSHYLPYLTQHQLSDDMKDDVVSSDPSAPSDRLAPRTTNTANAAIAALKAQNMNLNTDGGGIAVFTDTRSSFTDPGSAPVLHPFAIHYVQPLHNELSFRSLAENTATTCLMAHVRMTSAAPVATLNCHPFVFGRWAFMHNGVVAGIHLIRRPLTAGLSQDAYEAIQGGTDSEVMGALLVDVLTGAKGKKAWHDDHSPAEMLEAVEKTFKIIHEAQRKYDSSCPPSSLNVCISDGMKMVATRFRNSEEEQPPSLYWSEKAGVTLNRKFSGHPDPAQHEGRRGSKDDSEHGKHVIIASEPSTFIEEDWHLLPRNSAIIVDAQGQMKTKEIGPF